MAWNGSGTFLRLYNWVADAAASIKILAARMDGEFDNYQGGLQNCITRDGQTPPTASISWGSQKITALADGTADTDAANLRTARSLVSEWVSYTGAAVSFVSTTSFKLAGVNVTTTFTVGRRVKIVHNGGATTSYATITASAFVTDTTVTVAVDGFVALVSTVTAVSYGVLDASNLSVPQVTLMRSLVHVNGNGITTANLTTATPLYLGLANTGGTILVDALSEFSVGTGRFTPKVPGRYRVIVQASAIKNGATLTSDPYIDVAMTGAGVAPIQGLLGQSAYGAGTTYVGNFSWVFSMAITDYLQPFLTAFFTGGPVISYRYSVIIERVS